MPCQPHCRHNFEGCSAISAFMPHAIAAHLKPPVDGFHPVCMRPAPYRRPRSIVRYRILTIVFIEITRLWCSSAPRASFRQLLLTYWVGINARASVGGGRRGFLALLLPNIDSGHAPEEPFFQTCTLGKRLVPLRRQHLRLYSSGALITTRLCFSWSRAFFFCGSSICNVSTTPGFPARRLPWYVRTRFLDRTEQRVV